MRPKIRNEAPTSTIVIIKKKNPNGDGNRKRTRRLKKKKKLRNIPAKLTQKQTSTLYLRELLET